MLKIEQKVSDEEHTLRDSSRNHFEITIEGRDTGNTVDVSIGYEIDDRYNKMEAQEVAKRIAAVFELEKGLTWALSFVYSQVRYTEQIEQYEKLVKILREIKS